MSRKSNYDKFPHVEIKGCASAATENKNEILSKIKSLGNIILLECYPGYHESDIKDLFSEFKLIKFEECFKTESEIRELVKNDLGDNPIFGYMSRLNIEDYIDQNKLESLRSLLENAQERAIIYGTGASVVCSSSPLIYADLARWEIQGRMRKNEISNLGVTNPEDSFATQYKWGYFIDWRVADRLKQRVLKRSQFILDTNMMGRAKLVETAAVFEGLKQTAQRPFRVVPFFDPGVWGGQWMKDVCDLDKDKINFAWCFDCVPEENSLYLKYGDINIEIPSINLVFFEPKALLGEAVYGRFGTEFPIRFDFLDTMDGQNLSLQVHPLTSYIQEHFGMNYTQDESYYMLDAKEGAYVYLGLKENINPDEMIKDLETAQEGGEPFNAQKHICKWPIKKHDHVLIPAGTVHCSGEGSMVLEISSTPYIFTFKLWDWGRVDLNGKPRPINIEHGKKNIVWDRTARWTKENLVNAFEPIAEGDGWREERTGLHKAEFIETRRHWFRAPVEHDTKGNLNVLNLVSGEEAIVESPSGEFDSFVVHYAETFIIPASVGKYRIRPYGLSVEKECATLKAFIRSEA